MADSLLFDGVDDKINFSNGGVPTIGPGMLAAIVKSAGVGGSNDIIMHNTSWDLYRHTGGTFRWWNGSAEHVGPSLSDGVWYLVSMTKASGTVAPRFHVYNYNTATWTHADSGSTAGNRTSGSTFSLGGLRRIRTLSPISRLNTASATAAVSVRSVIDVIRVIGSLYFASAIEPIPEAVALPVTGTSSERTRFPYFAIEVASEFVCSAPPGRVELTSLNRNDSL
jgi:hypothetical protein